MAIAWSCVLEIRLTLSPLRVMAASDEELSA